MSTSFIGVALGVASSVTTAVHAIVVKRSLAVVSGTLDLAYYSNLLSALVILPFVLVSGEVFTVLEMVAGEGEDGQFGTFLIGAAVTVSIALVARGAELTSSVNRVSSVSSFASPVSSPSRSPRPSRTWSLLVSRVYSTH